MEAVMYAFTQGSSKLYQALTISLVVGLLPVCGCDSEVGRIDTSLTVSTVPAGGRLRIRDAADVGFTSPVAEAVSDAGYEYADDTAARVSYPLCRMDRLWHPGMDCNILGAGGASDAGTRIYALTDGIVIDRANISQDGPGRTRICDGRDGTVPGRPITEWGSITVLFYYYGVPYVYEYGHMRRIGVGIGDVVRLGQELGEMGEVGAPGAYHLHFEIRTMEHVCHDGNENDSCEDNLTMVRGCEEAGGSHRPSQYFCGLLGNRADVTRMYQNPIEFLVSRSMDQYAEDTVGLTTLGDAVLPRVLAFPADTGTNANPSSLARQDIAWLRGGSIISADDLRDALVREYRPSVWGGSPGYLVFPVNHGASHPYWVRSAIGARWHELATSSVVANRKACGMPITGEYLNCPGGVRPCASVRQDFQTCYLTWQAGRDPELSGTTAYPHGSPGAYANAWGRAAPDAPRETIAHAYGEDDAGYRFAEAYERNGAYANLGEPEGFVHQLLDARYHVQVFAGGKYGRGLIVFDPENRIVSSNDPSYPIDRTSGTFVDLAYDNVMTIARDASGNPVSVVYGDRIQAHLIRTGFLDWYELNDGIRLVGAPLDDEYSWSRLGSDGRLTEDGRQDFESGNCLIWHWEAPGSGLAYCGVIMGSSCVGWETFAHGCPRVTSISIDGGSGRPVDLDLPTPATTGPDRGGGGSEPDAGIPAPDAGTPSVPSGVPCSADLDCPGYGSGWRCQSGTCRETDVDGDGYLGSLGDCNPDVARIHPGAVEICNGSDDDCDGVADEGIDLMSDPNNCGSCNAICVAGTCVAGACASICVRSSEVCNNRDDDCDGNVDNYFEACAFGCGIAGVKGCVSGTWTACTPTTALPAETCNGIDDDCDGAVDEDIPDWVTTNACGYVIERCVSAAMVRVYGRDPVAETCNNVDDDCDGTVDWIGAYCPTPCGTGIQTCSGGVWGVCNPPYATSAETCNGIDDDCDGTVDEGACAPPTDPNQVRIRLTDPRVSACPGGWKIKLWLAYPAEESAPGAELVRSVSRLDGHSAVTLWCDGRAPDWYVWDARSVNVLGSGIFSELTMGGVDLRSSTMICEDPCSPGTGVKPIIMWNPAQRGRCPTTC